MTEVTAHSMSHNGEVSSPKASGAFSSFEWMIAWRYLRARRKEAFISVIAGFSFLGIMLGVATLIIVMAVMNGFRTELLDRILGLNGHLIINPIGSELTDYETLSDRISKVEGVTLAIPLIEGQALVTGNYGNGTGALVRGIREVDLKRIDVANNIKAGSIDGFDVNEGVAVGRRLADSLGLQVGDEIKLISPDGDVTAFGTTPRVKSYPVDALFEIGMSEYDSSFIFMPLEESQLYFNAEGRVDVIDIFVDDPDKVDEYRLPIETAAQRQIFLADWRQRNVSLFSALTVERNVMFMILTLIVLVAALNIISGLIMLVKDKSHDIAILRTMGTTRASIMRIFMITGSAIGIVGTIVGVILGIIVCLNIKAIQNGVNWLLGFDVWDPTVRFLTDIPAQMDPWETGSIIAMALTLSFLATLIPAWRAARLDPVEALRYE
ncbi:MAG: lipoprotein-releasing ABC transporter permease subunit [Pseudomonadota bacterium]